VIQGQELRYRPHCDDLALGEHRDTVADRIERVEIVGDEEHGEAERIAEFQDELVECRRADRIEPRGGLVEEQQLGIERQRAGDAGPLLHAAGKLAREFGTGFRRQTAHHDLVRRDLVHQLLLELWKIFADRHLDVFGDGQGREEGRALEQYAPALADILGLLLAAAHHGFAEHQNFALLRRLQPDDRAHQHRLARAGTADDPKDFAPAHVKVSSS
jgi:hypothetical protein